MQRASGRLFRRRPRRGRQGGFTLLEVMLATALMAVGTTSVMVVLASAAGFASKRQAQQRMAQVLEEARYDAQATANVFRPTEEVKLPGGEKGVAPPHVSQIYEGYTYQLTYAPVDPEVPEAGFNVNIVVTFGDGQRYEEEAVVSADLIPTEEFLSSLTFEQELSGEASRTDARETR